MNKTIAVTAILISASGALTYVGFAAYQQYRVEVECEALIDDAMKRADASVGRRLSEFATFVDSSKAGVKPFSEDIASLGGSVSAIRCKLPGASDECFQEYVVKKFGEHIFTPEAFGAALKRSIAGGSQDIEKIENELAISLKKELAGKTVLSDERLLVGAEFKHAETTTKQASDKDLAKSAAGLVATELVTYAGTQGLVRLGVSSGVLAAGAANSWWTFGGSLALGVALSELWTYVTQPALTIENEMTREVEKMSLNGSNAIRTELGDVVTARKVYWRAAMKGALK